MAADCSCIPMLASNIWNCTCMLLAERFLSIGFQLVLSPRSRLVLLLVTSDLSLSMSSGQLLLTYIKPFPRDWFPIEARLRKATIGRLLVCCSRRISAQRLCKSARSDHFPSFHPVSSLQLPYIVGQHGLNAGRSSHCFLTRCSDVLQ